MIKIIIMIGFEKLKVGQNEFHVSLVVMLAGVPVPEPRIIFVIQIYLN